MPLYTGMSYGSAPGWCFPLAEGTIYALFLLCLISALKAGRQRLGYLLGGFAFGVLLEWVGVRTGYYSYGRFRLMLGHSPHGIPLCVGAAWGIIMYTARLFSDTLKLPLITAAALDALLALNIDLSMDVVAYRLHMWHWVWPNTNMSLTRQWFGVPYNNFIGWLLVVFCYSALSRLFERKLHGRAGHDMVTSGKVVFLAVLSSLTIFSLGGVVLLPILIHLGFQSRTWLVLLLALLLAVLVTNWPTQEGTRQAMPVLALWVPLYFHLFFTALFFILGFGNENSWLTTIAVLNLLAGILVHLVPVYLRNSPGYLRN